VTNLGDLGVGSGLEGDLRYAINNANANSEPSNRIEFAPGLSGTITLVQGALTITKSVDIAGPGASVLTVSGNHRSGVFYIPSSADPQTVDLSDLTIADGTGVTVGSSFPAGGGLYADSSMVTLTRCTVTGNSATIGGGIYSSRSTMVLDSSTVTSNQAVARGGADGVAGGLDNAGGTMTLTGTTVSGNSATDDGGIENSGTMTVTGGRVSDNFASQTDAGISNLNRMTVVNATIAGNTSPRGDGGVHNVAGSRMKLVGCTVAGNSGGGIINDSVMVINGCTIVGNTASFNGAGLSAGPNTVVFDSTIVNNTTDQVGGGVYFNQFNGVLEIAGSTITGNAANGTNPSQNGGGGIWVGRIGNSRLVIDTTIVAENISALGAPDVHGPVDSLGFNLIGQADGSSGWVSTDQTGSADTPLDPMLGPLQDNGGPTQTRAPIVGSPAFNAGDPALQFTRDQRGSIRRAHQTRTDVGAVEAEPVASFRVTAPAQATAGDPFTLTVVALDQQGNTATAYAPLSPASGIVHFSSTDPAAQLPADYAFTPQDQGAHNFTAVLATAGDQAIQVVDTGHPSYAGAATVSVTPPSVLALLPSEVGDDPRLVTVAVEDFNRDGILDLVVANTTVAEGSSNASVLLGNDEGNFQTPVTHVGGRNPRSFAVEEFNGHGLADLAIANDRGNDLVLLGGPARFGHGGT
jgi:hypothetical protein